MIGVSMHRGLHSRKGVPDGGFDTNQGINISTSNRHPFVATTASNRFSSIWSFVNKTWSNCTCSRNVSSKIQLFPCSARWLLGIVIWRSSRCSGCSLVSLRLPPIKHNSRNFRLSRGLRKAASMIGKKAAIPDPPDLCMYPKSRGGILKEIEKGWCCSW